MVFSTFKAWFTAALNRRRLIDELAELSPDQLRDAGLDRSDVVLPRRVEPDDVMLQRVGWRAEHGHIETQERKGELRMSRPETSSANVCSTLSPRFSTAGVLVAP
jgi:hypothetical protein